ncbi:MAG: anthranilate synthase component I [Deltaproteobacteria bacterium]|nr:anthranilate synthase component I [Deltaproteobacteria bacterium]
MEKTTHFPSKEEFISHAEASNVIPVYREVLSDMDTPVSAFMKIDDGKDAFLLESVEGGEKWGRFSFLGVAPRAVIRSKGDITEIIEDGVEREVTGDPLETLKNFMSKFKVAKVDGVPMFTGGSIGYLGYDMVRHFEKLPDTTTDELQLYDMYQMLTDTMLVFDRVKQKIMVIANVFLNESDSVEDSYNKATAKIDMFIEKLGAPLQKAPLKKEAVDVSVDSNFKKEDFLKSVESTKEYIRSGDIIQAVISQRFVTKYDGSALGIYRALRTINPSPYMFYLRLGDIELAGSSPEILVKVEGDEINVRPIAGTRPRGGNAKEDEALEKELLADPKERAEHIMLVDLGRNDIGRVSRTGSVKVDELMVIERYSHVMHIVSNVHGIKADNVDSFDVLRASFPAGTLSGAPKIRAMEIIEEVEPCKRGVYGGCVGYFSFNGDMDVCITIRTVLVKDGKCYLQAGAGIVADSDPESEYQETVNKAAGILKAVSVSREEI